jgi:hypothetical protein
MIEEVKYESQRTAAAQKIKLWLNENDRDIRAFVEVAPDAREAEEDYSELLKRYLFKRRPFRVCFTVLPSHPTSRFDCEAYRRLEVIKLWQLHVTCFFPFTIELI